MAEVVWLMLIEVWACSFCQTMDGTKAQCHSISKGVSVVKRVGRSRRHVGLESTSIPPLALECETLWHPHGRPAIRSVQDMVFAPLSWRASTSLARGRVCYFTSGNVTLSPVCRSSSVAAESRLAAISQYP